MADNEAPEFIWAKATALEGDTLKFASSEDRSGWPGYVRYTRTDLLPSPDEFEPLRRLVGEAREKRAAYYNRLNDEQKSELWQAYDKAELDAYEETMRLIRQGTQP